MSTTTSGLPSRSASTGRRISGARMYDGAAVEVMTMSVSASALARSAIGSASPPCRSTSASAFPTLRFIRSRRAAPCSRSERAASSPILPAPTIKTVALSRPPRALRARSTAA